MNKEVFDKLYKKVEGKLFNYNKIKDDIEIINLEIEKVKNNYTGCGGISYDSERTGKTYSISNTVEQEVIRKEERINYLEYRKKELEIEKNRIDIAIKNFTLQQKELFEILYCSKKVRVSRREILEKMHISKSTYYQLRRDTVISALNSMYPRVLIDEIYTKLAN